MTIISLVKLLNLFHSPASSSSTLGWVSEVTSGARGEVMWVRRWPGTAMVQLTVTDADWVLSLHIIPSCHSCHTDLQLYIWRCLLWDHPGSTEESRGSPPPHRWPGPGHSHSHPRHGPGPGAGPGQETRVRMSGDGRMTQGGHQEAGSGSDTGSGLNRKRPHSRYQISEMTARRRNGDDITFCARWRHLSMFLAAESFKSLGQNLGCFITGNWDKNSFYLFAPSSLLVSVRQIWCEWLI